MNTNQNDNGEIIVSGRELHEFLEVKERYTQWIERMLEYGFSLDVDYVVITEKVRSEKRTRTYDQTDHHIKLDMAKEISMIQRTEKGKKARQYFLQLEKMWNSPEMIMKRALQYADQKVIELNQKIENDKHKVFFAEAIEISKNSILIKDLSVLLKQKGVDIGQNRLFQWLREYGYLCTGKAYHNKPTQRSMDLGLFELSTHIHTGSDGQPYTKHTPKVTGKGQLYFVNKFLELTGVNKIS